MDLTQLLIFFGCMNFISMLCRVLTKLVSKDLEIVLAMKEIFVLLPIPHTTTLILTINIQILDAVIVPTQGKHYMKMKK
jgi:hypothetical protein